MGLHKSLTAAVAEIGDFFLFDAGPWFQSFEAMNPNNRGTKVKSESRIFPWRNLDKERNDLSPKRPCQMKHALVKWSDEATWNTLALG